MWRRIAIENYSGFPGSGVIFTIALELELCMIGRTIQLMVVSLCSAPLVHRWISTYPLRRNGKLTTGKQEHYCLLPLSTTDTSQITLSTTACCGWQYEISPSDHETTGGWCFIVRWGTIYGETSALCGTFGPRTAKTTREFSQEYSAFIIWQSDKCQEIEMQ